MVETVSAQPSAVAHGTPVAAVRLEPGTELKARVEANLPGGVVRLATDDAKFDLKLPVRLPPGSDVIVTVSGNRANPVIQVTTPQVLPGEPAPPVTAQQPQQTPPSSQALPGRPASGQVQAPATSGAVVSAGTASWTSRTNSTAYAGQTRAPGSTVPRPAIGARPAGATACGPKGHCRATGRWCSPAIRPADGLHASGPLRRPHKTPSGDRGLIRFAAGARPQSGAGSSATLPPAAARSGAGTPAPAVATVAGQRRAGQPARSTCTRFDVRFHANTGSGTSNPARRARDRKSCRYGTGGRRQACNRRGMSSGRCRLHRRPTRHRPRSLRPCSRAMRLPDPQRRCRSPDRSRVRGRRAFSRPRHCRRGRRRQWQEPRHPRQPRPVSPRIRLRRRKPRHIR